jgi:diamine N-acetyltransferase
MSAPESASPPTINIVGDRAALGPECRDLLPTVQRWLNDFTLRRTQGGLPRPWTLDNIEGLYAKGDDGGRRLAFVIYRRADWRPIGFTAWQDIDYQQCTAEFVIGIGEADCRGQGYGTETTRLMLDYAFTALGLHSAMLTVYAPNIAGLRAYTKAGFKECGRRRESYLMGGKRWDTVYMDCLASEFTSPILAAIFAPDTPREDDMATAG